MNWIEEMIEPEIRSVVKLLRDNGFNTESSCGHEMYVQCQIITDGEIKRIDDLLFNNSYRDYKITVSLRRIDGHLYPTMRVDFVSD